MNVAIVGGHGQIALLLHPILRERGHTVRGLIRKPEQADDLRAAGAEPVICDLETESDISGAVGAADAVVFAAGAGPGSGAERKWTVDRDGALKLLDAARKNGIGRYVMISAMGADEPRGEGVFRTYLEAKAEADRALRDSDLQYTILRPGRLTNDPGTGRVSLGPELPSGEIPRSDVAAVIAAVLETPSTASRQFDLIGGEQPIEAAIEAALGGSSSDARP